MRDPLIDSVRSFRSLPGWVQVWVGLVLVPVNAAPFFFSETQVGRIGIVSTVLIVITNVPIMLAERGMSRLMSVPHLVIWIPLLVWLVAHLQSDALLAPGEWHLAIALIVINGISLLFDALDTWRWWRGARDVPGHPVRAAGPANPGTRLE